MRNNKISFCTTCMNRAYHLKQTLSENLLNNVDYENLEFIILDYNSEDELEDYIRNKYADLISTGKIIYYRTNEPKTYRMSHSRNMAFRLATGDIVCNIDADNFTGYRFASYINDQFNKFDNFFLSTHKKKVNGLPDILGRICVKKSDFLAVNGYDERMLYYGFDDYDFVNRLKFFGLEEKNITDNKFLNAIRHSNIERIANMSNHKDLNKILIKYISPASSELFFFYNDKTFVTATMINNKIYNALVTSPKLIQSENFEYSILENDWIIGKWRLINDIMELRTRLGTLKLRLEYNLNFVSSNKEIYYKIVNPKLVNQAVFFFQQISNRLIMEDNLIKETIKVNLCGFGRGIIYRNFDSNSLTNA